MATLFVGHPVFAYPAWKPGFYPAKLPANQFLKHYAERLNCVEINYTFRRLPAATTLAAWVEATPACFVFAVKANMRITHILRLRNAEAGDGGFSESHRPAADVKAFGTGAVPVAAADEVRCGPAAELPGLLPTGMRYAFEFRHASWLVDEVYDELRRNNVSLCVAESEKLEVPEVITADFVYYRLRKPEYTEEDVDALAARARELLATERDLYLMFKHEETPAGALNAELLLKKA